MPRSMLEPALLPEEGRNFSHEGWQSLHKNNVHFPKFRICTTREFRGSGMSCEAEKDRYFRETSARLMTQVRYTWAKYITR